MVTEHLAYLTDLIPGTTHHFRVMSRDAAGNLAVSDEHTFATLETPAAAFTSSYLSISPSEVNIGETVTISVLITNTGNAAGSYEMTLKINGVVEATQDITLNAGASEEVNFTVVKAVAGNYTVEINGFSSTFVVREEAPLEPTPPELPEPTPPELPEPTPPELPEPTPLAEPANWPLIWGIIFGVVAVGATIFLVLRKRRA
jgi:hypothetical protein